MFRKVAVCAAAGGIALLTQGANGDSTYGAPEPAYSAPEPAYGAPEPAYSAPEPAYGAPEPSYEEPAGYAAPSYAAVEEGVPDLTPIIIGILVLTGLSLLFPTYVTLTGVRKRRSADGIQDEVEGPSMAARMLDIMQAVATSEQCMERIACEIGGMADNAGMDKTMSKIAEQFVSKKAQKLMKKFNGSEDCRKIKCGVF